MSTYLGEMFSGEVFFALFTQSRQFSHLSHSSIRNGEIQENYNNKKDSNYSHPSHKHPHAHLLKVHLVVERRIADRNFAQFRLQAQELAANAHEGRADRVQQPPADGGGEGAVVPPAHHQVDHVKRHGKVQTQLGPAHDEPERARTDQRVEHEREDHQPAAQVGHVDLL